MTIDVQLTWPGLAELLQHYECLEVRPITGADVERETMRVSQVGTFGTATHSDVGKCLPILTPPWRFPSEKLPGVVRIEHSDCWHHPEMIVTEHVRIPLTDTLCMALGIEAPELPARKSTCDWLNPDHPANKGE